MFGGNKKKPAPTPEVTGLEDQSISSSQEGVAVPVVIGRRKLKATWISNIYNQTTRPVPVERPGKK